MPYFKVAPVDFKNSLWSHPKSQNELEIMSVSKPVLPSPAPTIPIELDSITVRSCSGLTLLINNAASHPAVPPPTITIFIFLFNLKFYL